MRGANKRASEQAAGGYRARAAGASSRDGVGKALAHTCRPQNATGEVVSRDKRAGGGGAAWAPAGLPCLARRCASRWPSATPSSSRARTGGRARGARACITEGGGQMRVPALRHHKHGRLAAAGAAGAAILAAALRPGRISPVPVGPSPPPGRSRGGLSLALRVADPGFELLRRLGQECCAENKRRRPQVQQQAPPLAAVSPAPRPLSPMPTGFPPCLRIPPPPARGAARSEIARGVQGKDESNAHLQRRAPWPSRPRSAAERATPPPLPCMPAARAAAAGLSTWRPRT
jgi:hypothetical protein